MGVQLSKIPDIHRYEIKSKIFDVLQKSNRIVQKQLIEIITIIAKKETLFKWKQVIDEIKQQLSFDDLPHEWALEIGKKLFKRYRFESATDELWKEIDFVANKLATPLTEKFETLTIELTRESNLDSIIFIIDIYRSLITQEIPEQFVEKLSTWMLGFRRLLDIDQQAVVSLTILN